MKLEVAEKSEKNFANATSGWWTKTEKSDILKMEKESELHIKQKNVGNAV